MGTVAAGVAKAYADLITISGYDGGTGASPLSSIKYAGTPWELGLAETHQTLRANELRHRVRLQTDGGLKTGLDVIKAALIGAESFGFGTAPMVALGCKYLRICHLNNCATGVATQHNVLRTKYFIGLPDMVINYFKFVAQECREIMASMGVRSLAELIGHTELLEILPGETSKQRKLDLSPVLANSALVSSKPQYCIDPQQRTVRQGRAGREDAGRHARRHCRQVRRRVLLRGEQFSSLHRRAHFRRNRQALGKHRHERGAAHRHPEGLRRTELRRVECRRTASASRGRGQRLRGQGHGGGQRSS